jgi:ribose 5-phosphate isomerase RpiB
MPTASQNLDPAMIEAIVRDVLARLTSGNGPAASATASEIVVTGKLITVESFPKKLSGVQQVVAQPGAIVTPAARDLLKEKGIVLVHRAAKSTAGVASKSSQKKILFGLAETSFDSAPLFNSLQREISVQQTARVGLVDVVTELSSQVGLGGDRAVLITNEVDAAVCLANRQRGVRAVQGTGVEQVRQACEKLGANLLVLSPAAQGHFSLARLIKAFASSPSQLDARFQERLGR